MGRASARVAAYLLLAAVNALAIANSTPSDTPPVARLAHHCFDLGHFAVLTLVAVGLGWLGSALAKSGRLRLQPLGMRLLMRAAVGAALGRWLLPDDFANFCARMDLPLGPQWWGTIVGAAALAGIALLEFLPRPRLVRGVVLLGALGLAWLNGTQLAFDYPGVHFLATIVAAEGAALVLVGAPLPLPLRGHGVAWLTVGALWAALSVIITPPPTVWRNLLENPGSVLMPYLADWLPEATSGNANTEALERSEWFRDRRRAKPIPPTEPRTLPANPIVILITIDAARAELLEGDARAQDLPVLHGLKKESVVFTRARSASPSTATSFLTIFASRYYSQIYFTEQPDGGVLPIEDKSERVPELLSHHGIHTVQVAALHGLGQETGIGRGFDEELPTGRDYGRSRDTMQLILKALGRATKPNAKPLFIYAHFVDSHAPYTLGGKEGTQYQRYVREIALADRELGRLLKYLERNHLTERTLLIVGADHGEAFGEHGLRYHAKSLYEELLRVPLMVRAPWLSPRVVDVPVSLVDLGPTLLDLFGVDTPSAFMGQSLVPLMLGRPANLTRPLGAESGRRMQAIAFPDGIKVIVDRRHRTVQAYDLKKDPGELTNLADSGDPNVIDHIQATRRFFDLHQLKVPGWSPPWRYF